MKKTEETVNRVHNSRDALYICIYIQQTDEGAFINESGHFRQCHLILVSKKIDIFHYTVFRDFLCFHLLAENNMKLTNRGLVLADFYDILHCHLSLMGTLVPVKQTEGFGQMNHPNPVRVEKITIIVLHNFSRYTDVTGHVWTTYTWSIHSLTSTATWLYRRFSLTVHGITSRRNDGQSLVCNDTISMA